MKIGTRKSPLAMAQTEMVKAALSAAHPALGMDLEVVPMQTSGDVFTDKPLADIGGKGLFTKEIEEALLAGKIDIAVHSAKDMETQLRAGLVIGAVLPREDARDVLIARHHTSLLTLPKGATFGTASQRRAAQVKRVRPDMQIVPLRGNVATRLRKVEEGEVDATMLAMAGLKRLQMNPLPGTPLSIAEFIPAAGQGIVAIECRADDTATREALAAINHADSFTALMVERAVLAALDGTCKTPIGAYAEIASGEVYLRTMLAPDGGGACIVKEGRAPVADALKLAADLAQQLKAECGK